MPITKSQRDHRAPVIIRTDPEYPLVSQTSHFWDEAYAAVDDSTDEHEATFKVECDNGEYHNSNMPMTKGRVDGYVDACPIPPRSPPIKKEEDDRYVAENSSSNCCPVALLHAGLESNFSSAKDEKNGQLVVKNAQIDGHIKSNRPFEVYLARVIVYADRSTAKEVRQIYHSLVHGTKSIPRLFNRLRRVLIGAPQLFRQFREFVPIAVKSKWKAAEESIRTQDQVSNHKRRLRIEWIRLVEEHQEKAGDGGMPWFTSVESMDLEKLQTIMRFLHTAIKKNPPYQSSLTPQAWCKIQTLTQRLTAITETIASTSTTLDSLTEEKKNEWEILVRIDAASIAAELRRRSLAEIEKEEMSVSEVKV